MPPERPATPAQHAPEPDPRSLVTAAEAERLGIAPAATVRWWAQKGYIAAVGLDDRHGTQGGGHPSPLYRREVLEWMATRTRHDRRR